MNLSCKLIEKTFKDDEGISHSYYVLSFPLVDNSNLDITIKGDKARLLKLSNGTKFPEIDREIWEEK